MRWTLLRTLLPALTALVAAIGLAQPSTEAPDESSSAGEVGDRSSEASSATASGESAAPRPARSTRRRTRRSRGTRRETPAVTDTATTRPSPERSSISVGRHNRGRLLNGIEIAASEHLRFKRADADQHHGTDELVGLLHAAADHVWDTSPGTPLTVGDLSRPAGGRFRPHRSHQNGRDVDVGFYIHDLEGHPVTANRFVEFGPMGTTRLDPTWRFDDERNWLFVEHLLSQTEAPVQYMFVSRELRRRLLAEGSRRGADSEILARAAQVLYQPPVGGRHRDHFHVRVYCDPNDMPRCHDDGPRHPWLHGSSALADAVSRGATGLEDVLAAVTFFTAPPTEELEPEEAPPSRGVRRRGVHRRGRARRSRARRR